MKLLGAFAFAFALACNQSVPAGTEPITVYVVDAVSGASLCKADVTLNGSEMAAGGGTALGCYFVPTIQLSVGEAYTLSVSNDGYVSQTETGTIQSGGANVVVQLVPTNEIDGGTDAGDASTTDASDASSTDASDASNADASDASGD